MTRQEISLLIFFLTFVWFSFFNDIICVLCDCAITQSSRSTQSWKVHVTANVLLFVVCIQFHFLFIYPLLFVAFCAPETEGRWWVEVVLLLRQTLFLKLEFIPSHLQSPFSSLYFFYFAFLLFNSNGRPPKISSHIYSPRLQSRSRFFFSSLHSQFSFSASFSSRNILLLVNSLTLDLMKDE